MTMRSLATVLAAAAVVALAVPSQAQNQVVRITGQLLDVRNGYVYFTSGDAFKLSDAARIADYDTGQPTTLKPRAKLFARAIIDPATKQVVEIDLTTRRLAADAQFAQVASTLTQTKPITERAPEIVGKPLTGREVAVTFTVTVPSTTALSADVYISTDAGGWNPREIKLDRIDGQRYRAVRRYASGTQFAFRVTRGSWNSVGRDQNGLEAPAYTFSVPEVDGIGRSVTVYSWSDDRGNVPQQAAPGAIPTPFNPNPFPPGGIFPPSKATPPGGFPTPRPPAQPNRPPR
ncbi:MAG: hypothetical protein QOF71_2117 [Candidatus Eremiobacteraeota bacterium]|jgi:hypothetical protein|nr:hypothetical protein [Candidatus Eremiobacteraeota bacterium]